MGGQGPYPALGMAQEEIMALDVQRFIAAQDAVYSTVTHELEAGQKVTHWIWFIFPQLIGLGRSEKARRYGLADLDEARAYLSHPILRSRLEHCTDLILAHRHKAIAEILGSTDALKFHSCMTLFHLAEPDNVLFSHALEQFFQGSLDQGTLNLLTSN